MQQGDVKAEGKRQMNEIMKTHLAAVEVTLYVCQRASFSRGRLSFDKEIYCKSHSHDQILRCQGQNV